MTQLDKVFAQNKNAPSVLLRETLALIESARNQGEKKPINI